MFSSKIPSICLYAGSFDPPTMGHVDIILRAATLADKLIVGVGQNVNKTYVFSDVERKELLETVCSIPERKHLNVEVVIIKGLVADYVMEHDIRFMVRGLRNYNDLDSEIIMSGINRQFSGVETVHLMANENRISSTVVRETSKVHRRIEGYVPKEIEERVYKKLFDTYGNLN